MGHLTKGTNVEVEYYFSAGVPDNTSARLTIATLNGTAFDQAYESWADNQLNINKFEDGYVKGHISVDEAGLMFTSIPYDSGWTAYVDGRKTDIQTVAGAFIALDLEKGDHVIEFKYFPRGLKSGLIFTFAGWLVFALLMNAKTIKEKRGSKKGKPENEDRTDDEAAIE